MHERFWLLKVLIHIKDWCLCCMPTICETWVFFSTLARSFGIGVLLLMTYKHSSMIVQMSFVRSNWTSMFTMSSMLVAIANIGFVVFLPWYHLEIHLPSHNHFSFFPPFHHHEFFILHFEPSMMQPLIY